MREDKSYFKQPSREEEYGKEKEERMGRKNSMGNELVQKLLCTTNLLRVTIKYCNFQGQIRVRDQSVFMPVGGYGDMEDFHIFLPQKIAVPPYIRKIRKNK